MGQKDPNQAGRVNHMGCGGVPCCGKQPIKKAERLSIFTSLWALSRAFSRYFKPSAALSGYDELHRGLGAAGAALAANGDDALGGAEEGERDVAVRGHQLHRVPHPAGVT